MRTLPLFFVLGLGGGVAGTDWIQQNSGTTANLNSDDFADANMRTNTCN